MLLINISYNIIKSYPKLDDCIDDLGLLNYTIRLIGKHNHHYQVYKVDCLVFTNYFG